MSETETNENTAVENEKEKKEKSDTESDNVYPALTKRKKCRILSDSSESDKESESIENEKGS